MRALILGRLVAMLIVATALTVAPSFVALDTSPVAAAQDSDDDDNDNGGEEDGDDNRGHGNDEDNDDEDNPGRGNGNNSGNQGQGNEKEEKDTEDDKQKDKPVVMAKEYAVEVTCDYDAESDRTNCTFIGVNPPDAGTAGHIDVPEKTVCSEVVGGNYEYVDPDPNTNITGYTTTGIDGELTLILVGEVTTSGTTTYWFDSSDGIFPATGAALDCARLAADVPAESSQKTVDTTSTPVPDTGTLIVETYTCTDVPEDRTDHDWFGVCEPGAETLTFEITSIDPASGDPQTAETGPSGEVTFGPLTPGSYQLDAVDASWCHAKSDSVTTENDLIVEAGTPSTVWIFMCNGAT